MRRLIYIFIALISISCADKGNRKVSEKEPVNVGVLTVTPMSAQYYNVYVGEIKASGLFHMYMLAVTRRHESVFRQVNLLRLNGNRLYRRIV